MNETPAALGSCNGIEGRLHAVKYPDDRSAEVTFEVFSNGRTFGGKRRLLARMSNRLVLADLRRDDFSGIVAVAARKLSRPQQTRDQDVPGIRGVGRRANSLLRPCPLQRLDDGETLEDVLVLLVEEKEPLVHAIFEAIDSGGKPILHAADLAAESEVCSHGCRDDRYDRQPISHLGSRCPGSWIPAMSSGWGRIPANLREQPLDTKREGAWFTRRSEHLPLRVHPLRHRR